MTDKLDAETVNQLPDSIKIISNFAVGFGNIDLEAAKKRGIAVTNTPDVLTDATAEIGMLLILGACRRAAEGIESAKEGGWKWSADYLIGKQLTGARLGILGMGRIGQKIAKVAKSLGMIIHYHNRSKLSEDKAKETFEANFNLNDELYSQKKLIEISKGQDGILSSLTDKLDAETINQLPDSIKTVSYTHLTLPTKRIV